MRYAFGVDVGGTSIKTALITDAGELARKVSLDTDAQSGFEAMVNRLFAVMQTSCAEEGISADKVEAVGVGLPAFLSADQGTIVEAVNLGWRNVPLKAQMQRVFQLPITMENDANVAALGESWLGAGRGSANVLCITVGTGIGGGIVLDGKLLRGATGMAGEMGHLVLLQEGGWQCNCGHRGCLETLASATAIIRRAKELQAEGRISKKYEIQGAASVFQLADSGDSGARQVVADAAHWLGYGMALAAIITNPGKIVVGGGVSRAGKRWLAEVQNAFHEYALTRVYEGAEIALAELGNDAGVVGAARLALQGLD